MWVPKSSVTTLLALLSAAATTTAFVPATTRFTSTIKPSSAIAKTTSNALLTSSNHYHRHGTTSLFMSSPPDPDNSNRGQDETELNPDDDVLEKYGVDFTAKAAEGKLDPVIGRDSEIRRAIQILSRRTKNNPVLIGDPGVGTCIHILFIYHMLV